MSYTQLKQSAGKFGWLYTALAVLTVVGLLGMAAPAAKADTWNFTLTDPGNLQVLTFSFPTDATSTANPGVDFVLNSPVDLTDNGVDLGDVTASFWNESTGGGVLLQTPSNVALVDFYSSQLYTGTEADPTIEAGVYSGTDYGVFSGAYTLTVVDPTPTPEPTSILLLGTGLLGMIGLAGYQARRGRFVFSQSSSAV